MTVIFSTICAAQLSEVLMLTLSSGSRSDQTAVRFLSEASDSFDSEYDAYKMMNPNPSSNIYTVSDQYYAINALNDKFNEKAVDLHIRAAYQATYTIKAEEIGPFETSWSIHLIDHFLNQEIDLRKVLSYSFEANITDRYNRFSLKFTKSDMTSFLITENSEQLHEDIDQMIYTDQNKIMVSKDNPSTINIYINDLEGQLIAASETTLTTWTFSPNKMGVYVVHVSSNQHNYTKKVMIGKDETE